jgi:hypothetical protein
MSDYSLIGNKRVLTIAHPVVFAVIAGTTLLSNPDTFWNGSPNGVLSGPFDYRGPFEPAYEDGTTLFRGCSGADCCSNVILD